MNRIKNNDPILFQKLDGFDRSCSESARRHPVLITKEEKDRYEEKFDMLPYDSALEYGKDKNDQPLYYICPRFWCTKPGEEGPLTKEQIESGNHNCGNIITDTKKEKENEYIYSRETTRGDFKGHASFVKRKGKENDVCLPCCFRDWDEKRASECNPEVYNKGKNKGNNKDNNKTKLPLYVLGYNHKEALPEGRHGFIPLPIQQFMNIDSNTCIQKGEQRIVKQNCPIFLLYGVEKTENHLQSFVSCLADIYSYEMNMTENSISVNDFKKTLASKISLDLFVQLQNGTLVNTFSSKSNREHDYTPYLNERLFKNIDKRFESQLNFLDHCINSHKNFQGYLRDQEVKIDHTFLWDVVTRPIIFQNGLNLVIFEIVLDDITNKVRLVCPTSTFRKPYFDKKRPTVFIVKSGDLYQPIYLAIKKDNVTEYQKMFLSNIKSVGNMKDILESIQKLLEENCNPYLNKKSTYKFLENISVIDLYKALQKLNYTIPKRVVNYQGKTIALIARNKKNDMYIPCLPSTNEDVDEITELKWMDEGDIWNTYRNTVDFLKDLYKHSKKSIPCKPVYRVIENEMIVGIITLTNQFVQIDPPEQNIYTELPEIKSTNHIMVDKKLLTSNTDIVQHKSIIYIQVENQFYRTFRTTIRILMRLFEKRKIYKDMFDLYNEDSISHIEKMKKMEHYLRELSKDHIVFQIYDEEVLASLQDIFSCLSNPEKKKYCMVKDSHNVSNGVLVIPLYNLITKEKNEEIYYRRLADELLRHRRVHLFMFYPEQYLNIGEQDYRVLENELILPKSLLTSDFFNGLQEREYKTFARTTPYENIQTKHNIVKKPIEIVR